jgi:hypothetical protein
MLMYSILIRLPLGVVSKATSAIVSAATDAVGGMSVLLALPFIGLNGLFY